MQTDEPTLRDYCDNAGAAELKARIEAYWTARGYPAPQVKFHHQGFMACMRSARTDIRSNMKNGLPVS